MIKEILLPRFHGLSEPAPRKRSTAIFSKEQSRVQTQTLSFYSFPNERRLPMKLISYLPMNDKSVSNPLDRFDEHDHCAKSVRIIGPFLSVCSCVISFGLLSHAFSDIIFGIYVSVVTYSLSSAISPSLET